MNSYMNKMTSMLNKVDRRNVQLALIILALSLFVLGAGAPGALGDFTNSPGFGGF
jgi:hypothetical protein